MAALQAITVTGPYGMLGYWQRGAAHNCFEPTLRPNGCFSGQMPDYSRSNAANVNAQVYADNVVSLRVARG